MDFTAQFKAARRVSTPLVAVRTFDAHSTVEVVKRSLGKKTEAQTPLVLWDVIHGYRELNDHGIASIGAMLNGNDRAVSAVTLEALRGAERAAEDTILFFSNAHLFWNEPDVMQAIWNLRDLYKSNGAMLVLLCSPGANLPAELVNDVLVIDEPLPTAAELEKTIADLYGFAKQTTPERAVLDKAIDALIGLPAFPAEQSAAMCLDNKTGELDLPQLWERKRQIIAQTPGCSVYRGPETLADVRGLHSIVNFLRKRMSGKRPPKALLFQDEVEKAFAGTGTDLSGVKTELTGSYCTWFEQEQAEGITSIGLPGVSKSALAKAIANEYGIPLIMFDVAAMQSGIVGSSGANLRAAQKMVSALSQGRLLVLSTCNSIDAVPPEIRRRIGSLGIFFFDAPTAEERADILTLYRTKYGLPAADPAPKMDGWTGAEIKECCRKADVFGMTLAEASQYVVPVTRSSAERIRALRMNSSGKYLSASKPGVYQYSEANDLPPAMPMIADGRKMREVN